MNSDGCLEEAVVRENWDNIVHTLHIVFQSVFTTHVPQVSLADVGGLG